ncbi:sensor histidine kinase [Clostridium sp. UBA4548]|uniref:sensor histidine kinase n=1 Tax=Clostridium sp. UBA4548 TaxID=1946361 RepID=UPI0025BFBAE5|nr:HAMP domain-containing sensor histidine kinase [Clostridium sp. UBA4548]
MAYLVVVLLVTVFFLGFRLFYMESQVKSLTNQLAHINETKTNKRITIGLLNKSIEKLAEKINETIEIKLQSEANRVKVENDLRQTIANMSHDLRTPLTSIIGYIQFLKLEGINEQEKTEYLEVAEHRAKSLEILLNDFYELSLIDSLDYELNMEKLNINKILEQVALDRYADFMGRNINPSINIPSEALYIIGEKKSVERTIDNLLSNAIKYAKDVIDISLQVKENGAVLKISNTFTNLTQQDLENVFDRFYMSDKMRSEKGTGLGLSIAKGLVEKMGGSINCNIEEDMFNIYCQFKLMIN